ncbi:hypothetical protein HLH36_19530 [Gluconacetobacter aggeris]|uniref:Uncharacterized protein n=1 Tax=Gluconacetobacter aggeris TaxID=1286186 RepID=A0A7W4NYE6_9PROT|nr:hypothetical protein [Gluconacetobacter aggeris]MBB2170489.1 hypothetical protein [Gluconacetobacter aggeris]
MKKPNGGGHEQKTEGDALMAHDWSDNALMGMRHRLLSVLRKYCRADTSEDMLEKHAAILDYWSNMKPGNGKRTQDKTAAIRTIKAYRKAANDLLLAVQAIPEYPMIIDGRLDLFDEIHNTAKEVASLNEKISSVTGTALGHLTEHRAQNPGSVFRQILAEYARRSYEDLTGRNAAPGTNGDTGEKSGDYNAFLFDIERLFGLDRSLESQAKKARARALSKAKEKNKPKSGENSPFVAVAGNHAGSSGRPRTRSGAKKEKLR